MILKTIQTVIDRVRQEFEKVPDVPFSADEMQRLCGEDRNSVEMVLEFLADTKFLSRTSAYTRLSPIDRARTAPADLEAI